MCATFDARLLVMPTADQCLNLETNKDFCGFWGTKWVEDHAMALVNITPGCSSFICRLSLTSMAKTTGTSS